MKRTMAVLASSAVTALAVGAGSAAGSDWLWSPGLCKSRLMDYGVELGDGRTFNVAQAYCVGIGGPEHCEWTGARHSKRLYDSFYVAVRSYDGAVRTLVLRPTAKNHWRGSQLQLVARGMSSRRFVRSYGSTTLSVAARENDKGCAEPS
ncbi:MAG TPA: hypothetical protein VH950_14785 [Gaiellaceae bacterium]|jgi:hypothetical protein